MPPSRKVWLIGFVIVLIAAGAAIADVLLKMPGPGPLAPDPNPVLQNGQVRLSARGFFPLEPVAIWISRQGAGPTTLSLRETEAGIQGDLDGAYVVLPDQVESGAHVVQVIGQISGRQARATLYVRARAPWATLSTGEGKPHGKVGLVAGGFDPGEHLRIALLARQGSPGATPSPTPAAVPMDVAVLPTDRVGNTVWQQVKLPLVKPGNYSIVVQGVTSKQEVRKDLSVTAYQPSVELSPWAGPPGTKVQLNARGFEPGEQVKVFLGSAPVAAATVTADQYGNLWGAGPVRVPYQAGALPLTIRLAGTDSTAETQADFRVLKPKPWLELTQYWGAPGGSVEFSGGGWAGGERIAFHVGSALTPAVAYGRADDYGWLHNAGPATIPRDALYQVTFVAVGVDSHSVATATFKIVLPFGIRPTSG